MEFLKALFSKGPLTFEQLEAAVKEQKMNIVNLADGGYISRSKYDDTVNGLKGQVTELQGQIASRDGDLTSLREQLTAAQADAGKLGAPRGFKITVRDLKVNAGAGFLVAKTGDIMTMPGLPKVPSAEKIDVDENGKITGLF